jgi:hypothetical protein
MIPYRNLLFVAFCIAGFHLMRWNGRRRAEAHPYPPGHLKWWQDSALNITIMAPGVFLFGLEEPFLWQDGVAGFAFGFFWLALSGGFEESGYQAHLLHLREREEFQKRWNPKTQGRRDRDELPK